MLGWVEFVGFVGGMYHRFVLGRDTVGLKYYYFSYGLPHVYY